MIIEAANPSVNPTIRSAPLETVRQHDRSQGASVDIGRKTSSTVAALQVLLSTTSALGDNIDTMV